MSKKVDHGLFQVPDELLQTEDTSTDPEGAKRRAERPAVGSRYVNDMMEYNARANRYEPAQHFIRSVAEQAHQLYANTFMRGTRHLTEEEVNQALGSLRFIEQHVDQKTFNGFLYDFKDFLVKRLISSMIWMEYCESIRVSMENEGVETDEQRYKDNEDALERNRVAITLCMQLIDALAADYETVSLTDFAWINGAKQAAWDFLGWHKRKADAPTKRAQGRAKERNAEEVFYS